MIDLQDAQRLHPVGLAILAIGLLAMVFARRSQLPILFILMLSVLPMAQRFVIGGLDFPFARIMIIVLVLRVLGSNLAVRDRWRTPDLLLAGWWIWSALAQGALHGELKPVVTRLGFGVDAVGAYFLGRALIDSRLGFERLVRGVSLIAIAVVPLFLLERLTGRNPFGSLGGVPEYTVIRDGRLRCQGPFSHPIMAGLFWSLWMPLILASCLNGRWKSRSVEIAAMGCICLLVFLSSSSTPVMALFFAVVVFACFRLRGLTWTFVYALLLMLVMLHFMMEPGVHHLLARVNVIGGSTGWHRYHLMDQAIARIGEWWLIGTRTTEHWGWGLIDVTNQFVLEGVRGGLLGLLLYVAFVSSIARRCVRGCVGSDASDRILWSMFSSIIALVLSFLAVSIFGSVIPQAFFLFGATLTLCSQAPLTLPGKPRAGKSEITAQSEVHRENRLETRLPDDGEGCRQATGERG